MNRITLFILFLSLFVAFEREARAQCACAPLNETFGSTATCGVPQNTTNSSIVNHVLRAYNGGTNDYPDDGEYAIRCDGANVNWGWFGAGGTFITDHTADAAGQIGYYALVNSGAGAREFYHRTVTGLCANTTYNLTYYAGNIVRDNIYGNEPSLQTYVFPAGTPVVVCANKMTGGCVPTGGTLLGSSGPIPSETSTAGFAWHTYSYNFTTGAGVTSIDIVLTSLVGMNAGFDLAFDDVMVTKVGGGCPLPIQLMAFTVEKKNQSVLLKWSTVGEVNFSHFSIERSTDGINFETIGMLPGKGNDYQSDYTFTDNFNSQGNVYYRLKQYDLSGIFKYSEMRNVNIDAFDPALIYFSEGELIIQYNTQGEAVYTVVDILGKTVCSSNRTADEPYSRVSKNNFKSGVYIVKVQMGTEVVCKKIILH